MSNYKLMPTCPNEVLFTLEITMQLESWKKLRRELGNGYPACDFYDAVGDMVRQAEKSWQPKVAESE